jgi:hypothetical protein
MRILVRMHTLHTHIHTCMHTYMRIRPSIHA